MAKLRKMLGKIDSPNVVALMSVIETQSKETLGRWAINYAEESFLGIYEEECPDDKRLRKIITIVRECVDGNVKLKDIKPSLKEATQIARDAEDNPLAQAAARAIATACATIQTPTNALGFTFYGAAAVAYKEAGLSELPEVYDALAEKEMERALNSIREIAVAEEEHPAKIKWNC